MKLTRTDPVTAIEHSRRYADMGSEFLSRSCEKPD